MLDRVHHGVELRFAQISEAEFWSRYFTSQLWERHRASVRKSANDEVTKKKDDIFDQYLEEPDWSERRARHSLRLCRCIG